MFIEAAFESLPQLITQFFAYNHPENERTLLLTLLFGFSAAMSTICITKAIVVFRFHYRGLKEVLGAR